MRKRYVILLATIFLGFVAGLIWHFSQPPEPMYQGHPLSYWLEGYDSRLTTEAPRQSADNAMREVGTNAIPSLLRMLQEYDSPLKVKFLALVEKQHMIRLHHDYSFERNYYALTAFEALGPTAKEAVPDLIAIYQKNVSPASQSFAAQSLGAIGPAAKVAVPVLLTGLLSTNLAMRLITTSALGDIHSQPDLVVPVLINALSNRTYGEKVFAARALAKFGVEAKPAVPALIKLMNDSPPRFRDEAIFDLNQIDPEAVPTNYTVRPSGLANPTP